METTVSERYKSLSNNIDEIRMNRPAGFGKYPNVKVRDLPRDYCEWVFRNTRDNGANDDVRWRGSRIIRGLE